MVIEEEDDFDLD